MRPLAQTGITPNMLTLLGLLLSIVTAVVIAQGWLLAGGLLMLFAGIFDMFDGAIARIRNAATTFGAFFDSTLDRYSESIILFGLLYYALQRPRLQDQLWPFHSEQPWMIMLIYIAAVGSLLVSYTKARAEGLGLECRTGLVARPERVVILALGLLTGTTIWALVLLAVFSNVTALERVVLIWRITLHQPMPPSELIEGEVDDHKGRLYEASDGLESAPGRQLGEDQDIESGALTMHSQNRTGDSREASVRSVHTSGSPFSGDVHSE